MWTFRNIQVGEMGDFFVEEVFRTSDGDDIKSQTRHVPVDADLTNEAQRVQDIAGVVWTQAVKDAYAAHLAAQEV